MGLGSFDVVPKSFLGIDVGSSALKIVEISGWGDRRSLKNYGELKVPTLYDEPFRTFEKNALLLSVQDIARAVLSILEDAHIKEQKAILSISDFSSFFTNFELPPMEKKELADAVRFEARKQVPLPLSEVTLDWQLLEHKAGDNRPFQILLVAVPNEVIAQYEDIARFAGLRLIALEAEVFGQIRSYLKEERDPVILLDIGAQTTTVSAVYKGILRYSRSIDMGGNSFTERIAQSLSIDVGKAEQEKAVKGIELRAGGVPILLPLIDMVVLEIQKLADPFHQYYGEEIKKIVLGGGSAKLPGLREYIEKHMAKKTELIAPFRQLAYPPVLEDALQDMGPSFAVAVGMALRGFE